MFEGYPVPIESKKVVEGFVALSDEAGYPETEYCLEELAEVTQAIQKLKRARVTGNKISQERAKKHLITEIGHLYLTLNHLRAQEELPLQEIQQSMNEKIRKWGFENG